MLNDLFPHRELRSTLLLPAFLMAAVFSAQAATISVSGAADIWLAGQPNGSTVTGIFGPDTAPANSPVSIAAIAGHVLNFSVTGVTSLDNGACFAPSPDGGCLADVSPFGVGPVNGLSSFKGPGDALIGVFINNSVPSGPGSPAGLDFTVGNTSFASLAPLLNQVFFIGDGLTGTGSGAAQNFIVPAGATRLFLASSDALGASFNNTGSFLVMSTDVTPVTGVPEPATLALLSAGLGLSLIRRRLRA